MSVDRKTWGWCPSVVRPMPLDDGLMVRIRLWMDTMTAEQALGLANLAERHGAGVIELTNRANLQLRGLTEAEHAALVPELEALGLTRIDRTASGRVNVTLNPFRRLDGQDADGRAAEYLSHMTAARDYIALPQKFGFVVDTGPQRRLADVPGDIRIEAHGAGLIVRADGCTHGMPATCEKSAVNQALELANWFRVSGGIGADGRGRMADLTARETLPDGLRGTLLPNEPARTSARGPEWITARDGRLSPQALRAALSDAVTCVRVTPFRALYLPELAPDGAQDNKAETASKGDGVDAV
ncbi:hypothetical protein [Gymnodinialimonas hymeniacidonis]|uniref:hypothetical protein n=1 Tax=Gymnodinialimonas hymeniacidonis TaxID=3126508 RepID=UPI0034C6771E